MGIFEVRVFFKKFLIVFTFLALPWFIYQNLVLKQEIYQLDKLLSSVVKQLDFANAQLKKIEQEEKTKAKELEYERERIKKTLMHELERISELTKKMVVDEPLINKNIVKVLYATNRNVVDSSENKVVHGGEYESKVTYGYCLVNIPLEHHEKGEIERPAWYRLEFTENDEKHVTLKRVFQYENFNDLTGDVAKTRQKKLFIFVHGYNVDFNEAALRTAQMSNDLDFDGVPIFYSWPSNGNVVPYMGDENNIERSTPHIRKFIEDVARTMPSHQIYLIGHSMGTRGLTRAIQGIIQSDPSIASRIKEVILAAPDIDAVVFNEQIMSAFSEANLQTTLYASNKDLALKASSVLHKYNRAGLGVVSLDKNKTLDIIDATDMVSDFLGHSYFGSEVALLNDMHGLMEKRLRPEKRALLKKIVNDNGTYWKFKE